MKRLAPIARLAGRLAATFVVVAFIGVVSLQFVRIVERNVALAAELHGVEQNVAELNAKHRDQQREIARLRDPAGAIPEIHDRLHMVGPHEAIIYLKGVPTPQP